MAYPSFNSGDVLNASDMNAVGMWLLETKTLTASAGPIQFNNAFTTDYNSYILIGSFLQNTSTAQWTIQFQDASNNAITGANYNVFLGGSYLNSGTPTFANFNRNAASSSIFVGGSIATKQGGFTVNFIRPRDAVETTGATSFDCADYDATFTDVHVSGGYVHELATAYYGCRINISAGTVTGKVSLYGYKA